jgi:hypothetical protein
VIDASSLQCEGSGLPFDEVIIQASPQRKRGRKIKAIDHSRAKAAWRHGMQWLGINPNAKKWKQRGETNMPTARFLREADKSATASARPNRSTQRRGHGSKQRKLGVRCAGCSRAVNRAGAINLRGAGKNLSILRHA